MAPRPAVSEPPENLFELQPSWTSSQTQWIKNLGMGSYILCSNKPSSLGIAGLDKMVPYLYGVCIEHWVTIYKQFDDKVTEGWRIHWKKVKVKKLFKFRQKLIFILYMSFDWHWHWPFGSLQLLAQMLLIWHRFLTSSSTEGWHFWYTRQAYLTFLHYNDCHDWWALASL